MSLLSVPDCYDPLFALANEGEISAAQYRLIVDRCRVETEPLAMAKKPKGPKPKPKPMPKPKGC